MIATSKSMPALSRTLLPALVLCLAASRLPAADAPRPEGGWWPAMLDSCEAIAQSRGDADPRPLPDFGKSDLTVTAWIRTTADGTIVAKAPERGIWVRQGKALFVREGKVVFDIGWVGCITSTRTVGDGQWHHVGLVMQGGKQQIFIDGRPNAAGTLHREPDLKPWVLKIGRTSDNFGGDFQGLIDEVRIYGRALSIREMAKAAEGQATGGSSDLAGCWPLDGDGQDASGSHNPATLAGCPEFVDGRVGKALKAVGGSAVVRGSCGDPLAEVWPALERQYADSESRQEMAWEREDGIWNPGWKVGDWKELAGRYAAAVERRGGKTGAVEGSADRGRLAAVREGYLQGRREEWDLLRRQAAEAGVEKLVFVRRRTYDSNHYYTEYINSSWQPGGNLCVLDLATGQVREIVRELHGGVFERFDLSFDARRIVFAWKAAPQTGYRIYEVNVDGSGLRQLTFPQPDEEELVRKYRVAAHYHHGTDDMQPCYLPDGGIAFISTRCQYGILCDGPDDFTTTVLYRMDADGQNLRRLSNSSVSEAAPVMLPDGRLMYTRWEYVDKGAVSVKCLWAMRPDGTGSSEIYGNDIALPPTMIYGRPIPGSANRYVVLGTPHCPQNGMGTVIRLDMTRNIRTREPMTYLTPYVDVQAEGGFAFRSPDGSWRHDGDGRGPLFKDPYPLSDGLFLVAHKPQGPRWTDPAGYGLYLLDERGRAVQIYRDAEMSCWLPYPLRPREKPPVLPGEINTALAQANQAVCNVSDVYQGLKGVPRGTIKYVRVLEQVPRPWSARRYWPGDEYDQQHACITKDTHLGLKVQHGVVPVENDGSASLVVPAGANIILQLLDDHYMAVQTERTFVDYMPGEVRSCTGCHETPDHVATALGATRKAMLRAPSIPGPQPGEADGRRALDYAADVQPVWDKHCVSCHGDDKRDGNLNLSGRLTDLFNVSYEQLVPERRKAVRVDRKLLGQVIGENHPKTGNVDYLPARSLGSHASVLVAMLAPEHVCLADPAQEARARKLAEVHREIKLAPEELLKVTNWVDTNCQYYGTYWGRKNVRYRGEPDFRPAASFEMAVSKTALSPPVQEERNHR